MSRHLRKSLSCLYAISVLLVSLQSPLLAQDCTETLDEAKALYAGGDFYPIPGLLSDCLRSGFTEEQKVEAYELLTIIYNYNAQLDSAETSYLQLLRTDPIYRPDSTKEVEIEFISKRYKTDPVWTVYGPRIGMNWTFSDIIFNNGTDNTDASLETYTPKIGGHIAAGVELTISKHFSLMGEGFFYLKKKSYSNQLYQETDNVSIDNSLLGIDFPISLKYQFALPTKKVANEIDKWYGFVFAGYSINLLLQDQSFINYNSRTGPVSNILSSRQDVSLTRSRDQLSSTVFAGLGVKYRLRTSYIALDVRYSFGLDDLLSANNQFDFQDTPPPRDASTTPIRSYTFGYSQIDDDFRLNTLYISIGYVHPFYKARPVDKKSIGDLIKGLFKKKEKDAEFY